MIVRNNECWERRRSPSMRPTTYRHYLSMVMAGPIPWYGCQLIVVHHHLSRPELKIPMVRVCIWQSVAFLPFVNAEIRIFTE
jgi:hypothetical protein